uniref:hypothetical protein n=1 Tax=Candidatus Cyanaurora vandensis TaxID=2714958 RepID=UPI00257AFCAD
MSKLVTLTLCLLVSQVPVLAQSRSLPPREDIPVLEPLNPRTTPAPVYDSYKDENISTFDVTVSRLAANTYLPASPNSSEGALYLDPNGEKPLSIFTSNDIYDTNNQVAIPQGSEIRGRFVPVRGGLKFQADAVVVQGQYYAVQASSDVLFDEKDPREYSTGAIAGDAAIGAGAGALLGLL